MPWNKKILLLDVKSMKVYFKTNEAIGEFLGLSERQAQRLVLELLDTVFLTAKYFKQSKNETRRILATTEEFNQLYHEEPALVATTKMAPQARQKRHLGHDKNGMLVLTHSLNNESKQGKGLMRRLYLMFPEKPWTKDTQFFDKLKYYQEKGSFEAMVSCVQEYQEQTG